MHHTTLPRHSSIIFFNAFAARPIFPGCYRRREFSFLAEMPAGYLLWCRCTTELHVLNNEYTRQWHLTMHINWWDNSSVAANVCKQRRHPTRSSLSSDSEHRDSASSPLPQLALPCVPARMRPSWYSNRHRDQVNFTYLGHDDVTVEAAVHVLHVTFHSDLPSSSKVSK